MDLKWRDTEEIAIRLVEDPTRRIRSPYASRICMPGSLPCRNLRTIPRNRTRRRSRRFRWRGTKNTRTRRRTSLIGTNSHPRWLPFRNLIELIEIRWIESTLRRLGRLAPLRKEFNGSLLPLSLLLRLQESGSGVDLHKSHCHREFRTAQQEAV